MSPSHVGRRAAAFREMKRAPQAATTSATSVAPTGTNSYAASIVNSTPGSTIALAVILSVFALVVLGICTWRYRVRRRRRLDVESEDPLWRPASSSSFNSEKGNLQQPKEVFIPIPHKGEAAWSPQVRNYLGVPLKNGELPKHVQAAREGRKFVAELPPSYQEKVVEPTAPSNAPLNKQLNVVTATLPSSRFSNPTPLLTTVTEEHPGPLPSPARSASFDPKHRHSRSRSVSSRHVSGELVAKITPSQARHSRSGSTSEVVRLMTVINTFHPSLDDELHIQLGDCVRLIEEYHDGWATVQHVGRADSPRGVVPRFCLVDRTSAPPKSRKRSLTQSAARV
jgi:hypothetical protein